MTMDLYTNNVQLETSMEIVHESTSEHWQRPMTPRSTRPMPRKRRGVSKEAVMEPPRKMDSLHCDTEMVPSTSSGHSSGYSSSHSTPSTADDDEVHTSPARRSFPQTPVFTSPMRDYTAMSPLSMPPRILAVTPATPVAVHGAQRVYAGLHPELTLKKNTPRPSTSNWSAESQRMRMHAMRASLSAASKKYQRTRTPYRITSSEELEVIQSPFFNEKSSETYLEQCFDVCGSIGRGCFGDVTEVRERATGRTFAVKRLRTVYAGNSDRDLKLREVIRRKSLGHHPNLVWMEDAWEERGHLHMLMELCSRTLSDYLYEHHTVNRKAQWQIFIDLLNAVNYMHSMDFLHGDIKPENVLLSPDMVCKLGDFSLTVDLKKDRITMCEGDSKYMARELLDSPPSKASDVFCLGISMLEVATDLVLPSSGEAWHLLRNEVELPQYVQTLCPELRQHVAAMMRENPALRPTTSELVQSPSVRRRQICRQWLVSKSETTSIGQNVVLKLSMLVVAAYRLMLSLLFKSDVPVSTLSQQQPSRRVSVEEAYSGSQFRRYRPIRLNFNDTDSDPSGGEGEATSTTDTSQRTPPTAITRRLMSNNVSPVSPTTFAREGTPLSGLENTDSARRTVFRPQRLNFDSSVKRSKITLDLSDSDGENSMRVDDENNATSKSLPTPPPTTILRPPSLRVSLRDRAALRRKLNFSIDNEE